MDIGELSPERLEKVFQLCDVMNLADITLAVGILQSYEWDLQKAVNQSMLGNNPFPSEQPTQQQQFENPLEQDDEENFEFEYNYDYNPLQKKRQLFDEQHVSFPLSKTTSVTPTPNSLQRSLSKDRTLTKEDRTHEKVYRRKLVEISQLMHNRILQLYPQSKRTLYENNKKIQNNQKFIAYLYEHYQPKINFTFGTLLLNLVRSYLQKKFLLVYVHKQEEVSNKAVEMLLTQRQTSKFVNQHCVVYGMFDNSDDYEIVEKYIPMNQVPLFILFTLDKKNQSEKYISHYTVLRKQSNSFLQWLAKEAGVSLKRKNGQVKKEVKQPEFSIPQLMNEQNLAYEEMEKLYSLQREKSKIEKNQIVEFKERVDKMKSKFEKQVEPQTGKTIAIRLRLPVSGKSLLRNFLIEDPVKEVFDYVGCFGREEFENPYGEFDLTQTFPKISLKEHLNEKLGQVFPGSQHENLVVKELW